MMLLWTIVVALTVQCCLCIPLENFYPFGTGQTIPPENGSVSVVLSQDFIFYEEARRLLYVNANGIISFNNDFTSLTPSPFPLSSDDELIAPYWAHADLFSAGTVFYRETNESDILARVNNDVKSFFPIFSRFSATTVFIVTWDGITFAFNDRQIDRNNTFQAILATNGIRSFVEFLYADGLIQWTTGDTARGSDGLGGQPAQAGINAGDSITSVTIPGSGTPNIINIDQTSNVNIPGVWVYQVDSYDNFDLYGSDISVTVRTFASAGVSVTIVSDPPGVLVDDDNNIIEHLIGSSVTFTCEVNTTLTFNDSDVVWGCSTGCFADMEMEQTINITEIEVTDSGVLNCSVIIDGVEYTSDPYVLHVPVIHSTSSISPTRTAVSTKILATATTTGAPSRTAISVKPTSTPFVIYGDPHFSVPLLHGGQLCYSIQGVPGLPFNLLSSRHLIINALFIDSVNDPSQATWIGKLAIIPKQMKNSQLVIFDSVSQSIKISNGGTFKAQFLQRVVINETGNIAVKATHGLNRQAGNPAVTVFLTDPEASFDVVFHKDHLDVDWKIQTDEMDGSHGLLGQFMVNGVEVDSNKQMLIRPGFEPIPVEPSKNWNNPNSCWLAKNAGNQGEGLIEGSIYDYILSSIESTDLPKKFTKYEQLK